MSDKVRAAGKVGYITGFTGNNAYIKDSDGAYATMPGKTYKQVNLADAQKTCSNRNWIFF